MKQKAKDLFKRLPKGPVAILMVVLLSVFITAGVTVNKKTVSIVIDGKETKIVTYKNYLGKILDDNNIKVSKNDKISKNLDSKVKDKDTIYIKRANDVKVSVDGKVLSLKSTEDNVQDMLNKNGIKLSSEDKVIPSKEQKLVSGMKVSVIRVTSKLLKQSQALDFTVVEQNDNNLEKGKKKVVTEGKKGEKVTTTKVVFENGKEVSKKIVSESVTKNPINQIVAVGTMSAVRPSRGGGSSLGYSRVIKVTATAYSNDEASTGKSAGDPYFGITATGTRARRNASGYSTIAVDPRVIPLGSKVYVEGYGLAIAEDIGGAIKGNRIDVFVDTVSQANAWGVRQVNVYILK